MRREKLLQIGAYVLIVVMAAIGFQALQSEIENRVAEGRRQFTAICRTSASNRDSIAGFINFLVDFANAQPPDEGTPPDEVQQNRLRAEEFRRQALANLPLVDCDQLVR